MTHDRPRTSLPRLDWIAGTAPLPAAASRMAMASRKLAATRVQRDDGVRGDMTSPPRPGIDAAGRRSRFATFRRRIVQICRAMAEWSDLRVLLEVARGGTLSA